MSNAILDVIKTRRSVRTYKSDPLTADQVEILTRSALSAPSAMNLQPWRIIATQNQELLLEMERDVVDFFVKTDNTQAINMLKAKNNHIFYGAPLVIFIPISGDGYSQLDAGIVVQTIALAATSMGLGSVVLGFPAMVFSSDKADYWKEKLRFPEGYRLGISIAIGYANDEGQQHPIDPDKIIIIE